MSGRRDGRGPSGQPSAPRSRRDPRGGGNKRIGPTEARGDANPPTRSSSAAPVPNNAHLAVIQQPLNKFISDLSDSSDEEDAKEQERTKAIAESTLVAYQQELHSTITSTSTADHTHGGASSVKEKILDTTKQRCGICLEKIKSDAPVWQCDQCYILLHLFCIQKWVRTGVRPKSVLSPEYFPEHDTPWMCPNCRHPYPAKHAPSEYRCYCGKTVNPPFDPWLVPHSCGAQCGKPLGVNSVKSLPGNAGQPMGCGHTCTLLCHPGPCPPCPQTVTVPCFCGKRKTTMRCGTRGWECGAVCGKMLPCGMHTCTATCHAGEACPPCTERIRSATCRCGRQTVSDKICSELFGGHKQSPSATDLKPNEFSCDQMCGQPLSCGVHICQRVCHAGGCGMCPLSTTQRTCPCGKKAYPAGALACGVPASSCGDTCGKMLACGYHRCSERCHQGACPKCRVTVVKRCRCGQTRKSMACSQEFTCDKKCRTLRNCGRHKCSRKCCTGECPPCDEVCGRMLRCKNHRCEANCHPGDCLGCPLTVTLACFCGRTTVTLPCGAERGAPPPECSLPCSVPSFCHHPERERHHCHFGPCDPCRQPCGVVHSECRHPCPLPCHDTVPDFNSLLIGRKKRRPDRWPARVAIDAVKCPPCPVPVVRSCLGRHEERTVPCSSPKEFGCGRACGNLLACGNHHCPLPCHVVTLPRRLEEDPANPGLSIVVELPTAEGVKDSCKPCKKTCSKPRNPFCKHPCSLPCHAGECPPCEVLLKRQCHCKFMTIHIPCWQSHNQEEVNKLLSCGSTCRKPLPNCTHLCDAVCHAGLCPSPDKCSETVQVRCACKRRKENWPCYQAQEARSKMGIAAVNNCQLLPCDGECERMKKEKAAAAEAAKLAAEAANAKPAEAEGDSPGEVVRMRRRYRKRRVDDEEEISEKRFAITSKHVIVAILVVIFVAFCFLVYRGMRKQATIV